MMEQIFLSNILTITDLILTTIVIYLFTVVRGDLHRLKEDHFDLQVTYTRIMDGLEANRHEINKIKDKIWP